MDERQFNQNPSGQPAPAEQQGQEKQKSDAYDWIQCIVTALVACILLFTFVGRTVGVVGSSMLPTLVGSAGDTSGDRLIISKLFYTPKYGDIVVLQKDEFADYPIIKRVIATEGQTVEIDFDTGTVTVDGEELDEPYIRELTREPEDFKSYKQPVTVPEGCIFVMGDNRNHSTDSRSANIKFVDNRYIIGKALLRLTPFSKFGGIYGNFED